MSGPSCFLMKIKQINIGRDFSDVPMGRYHPTDGNFSGQRFRDEFLVPALQDGNNVVEVTIDDTEGFGSSFLEEAFGGLVRKHGFTIQDLEKRLKIIHKKSGFWLYEKSIWKHIRNAKPEKESS